MTVDELIKELQKISESGKGNYEAVDGDSGRSVKPCVWDNSEAVSL
jgi:hypothetical protein